MIGKKKRPKDMNQLAQSVVKDATEKMENYKKEELIADEIFQMLLEHEDEQSISEQMEKFDLHREIQRFGISSEKAGEIEHIVRDYLAKLINSHAAAK